MLLPEPVAPPTRLREPAPAKLNLALHVRRRRDDGYHELETLFAFCTDGDWLEATTVPSDRPSLSLELGGPFGSELDDADNLVRRAFEQLAELANVNHRVELRLDKRLPVASGLGGGSADAAATLRLLTALWRIDPAHAWAVAPRLGADVPACLLSMTARGEGVGDALTPVSLPELSNRPVLLVNPRIAVSTPEVFGAWDGHDCGPLGDDWQAARNDLEAPAIAMTPAIADVLGWLRERNGAEFARMSGSGATCFALFTSAEARDGAATECPDKWWHLATSLR